MGTMQKMDGSGDTKIVWDPDNREEVENAKKTFDDLVKNKKFAAFTVKKGGEKHKRIYTFDKFEEKLIMVPQFQGG